MVVNVDAIGFCLGGLRQRAGERPIPAAASVAAPATPCMKLRRLSAAPDKESVFSHPQAQPRYDQRGSLLCFSTLGIFYLGFFHHVIFDHITFCCYFCRSFDGLVVLTSGYVSQCSYMYLS